MNGKVRIPALLAVLALLLLPLTTGTATADGPTVNLSKSQAGTGGSITVSGSGWRSHALLMMLICGQSVPSRGVIGGTNSCANADGRAVTTDAKGAFSKKLPVSEPPVPCPCVVHVATVEGAKAQADAIFQVAGHAVEPLPAEASGGRLSVLTDTRLDGSSGLLTWFGAPPSRTLVFTVGNVGTGAIKNPVFQVGTSHGVFAPQWEDQQARHHRPRQEGADQAPRRAHGGRARRLHRLLQVRREGPRRAALGRGPPVGRDPVLDPGLPGRARRAVPRRDGRRGPGTAAARRRPAAPRAGHARTRPAPAEVQHPGGRSARLHHDPAVVHPGLRSGHGRSALRTARRQPDESYDSHQKGPT